MAAIQGAVETVARVFHDSLVPGVTGGHDVQDGYDMMIGANRTVDATAISIAG